MRLLITGGAGMIGQAIARRHLAAGDEVFIFDRFVNPFTKPSTDLAGTLVLDLRKAMAELKPDILSIQASLVSVGQSQLQPQRYYDNNLGHVGECLQLMLDVHRPSVVLFAGSMGPYGNGTWHCLDCNFEFHSPWKPRTTLDLPCPLCGDSGACIPLSMRECLEPRPLNPYAVTKHAQELALKSFAHTHGIRTVSLRYFSVYSGTANPLNPFTGVLSIIGNKLLNVPSVELNEDALQTRDLVHADDCASAHLHFSRYQEIEVWRALNVGTGQRTSLLEVAQQMSYWMGIPKPIVPTGRIRSGDARHCGACTVNSTGFGWRPLRALATELPKYCQWLLENRSRFTVDESDSEQDKLRKAGLLC